MKHTNFYVLVFFLIFALVMQPTIAHAEVATLVGMGLGALLGALFGSTGETDDGTNWGLIGGVIIGSFTGAALGFFIDAVVHNDELGDVRIAHNRTDNDNVDVPSQSIDISSIVDIELVSPLSFQFSD